MFYLNCGRERFEALCGITLIVPWPVYDVELKKERRDEFL